VAGAVLSATGVSSLLKALLHRPRPPEMLALIDVPGSYSLPSGHALVMGVFVGLLVLLVWHQPSTGRRVAAGSSGAIAVALIGLSRIYLGVHWASDVIGGWCVAGIWLLVLVTGFRAWMRSERAPVAARPWRSASLRAVVAAIVVAVAVAVFVIEAVTHPLAL
jgi:undecaprenyl-diphosphatase